MVDEIKGLKEELHRVSDSVKTNEENRKKAEATCVLLLREKQEFEVRINSFVCICFYILMLLLFYFILYIN